MEKPNLKSTSSSTPSVHTIKVEKMLEAILEQVMVLSKLLVSSASADYGAPSTVSRQASSSKTNLAISQLKAAKQARIDGAKALQSRVGAGSDSRGTRSGRVEGRAIMASEAPLDHIERGGLDEYEYVPWLLRDFCTKYAGRTITCRAVADLGATIFKRTPITEAQLKLISLQYPDLFKLVKTDNYEDSVYSGNKVQIKPNENPNRKRLSAIKIY